ncbi:MAG: MFS transporter [Opitutaceae bacterium]|jgi:GPH family glycoside/pentoside/hexuronide:cation symporter|nr:MFS transporter [Opitutaceae bacterium]
MSHEPPTSPREKLPLQEKIAWGSGGFSEQLATNGLNNLFIPIFNIGLGLDSMLVGWAISIPRFIDMITDPLMGNISDNCRSRFGRRRPFILAGGILTALAFGISYMASPWWSSWPLFIYAVLACIFFYLMFTIFAVPYYALGLELSDDYDERADLQKYRMVFASLATFSIPWLYKLCIETGEHVRAVFAAGESVWYAPMLAPLASLAADSGVKAEVIGVRYVAWAVALFILLSALPAFVFTRERHRQKAGDPKVSLFKSGLLILKNRSFRNLCCMIFLVILGMYFVGVLKTYANIFYICGGNKSTAATWTGFSGTVSGLTSLAGSFVVPVLVRHFDKRKVLLSGLLVAGIANFCSWFLLNPDYPFLQLVLAAAIGLGMSACWLLNNAFIADICDEDELLTGYRREGMFSAFFSFIVKMAFTGIALLLGAVLSFIGYTAGSEEMTAQAIFRLRLFITLFPGLCLLGAFCVFCRYKLDRNRLAGIQQQLRERRATAISSSSGPDCA